MRYFSRREVLEILAIDDAFLIQLEQEEIIQVETSSDAPRYSEMMLERVRVADNLVHELDVNLAGVAVIVQMRENLADLHHQLAAALTELQQKKR